MQHGSNQETSKSKHQSYKVSYDLNDIMAQRQDTFKNVYTKKLESKRKGAKSDLETLKERYHTLNGLSASSHSAIVAATVAKSLGKLVEDGTDVHVNFESAFLVKWDSSSICNEFKAVEHLWMAMKETALLCEAAKVEVCEVLPLLTEDKDVIEATELIQNYQALIGTGEMELARVKFLALGEL